jgi:hypothetical protein
MSRATYIGVRFYSSVGCSPSLLYDQVSHRQCIQAHSCLESTTALSRFDHCQTSRPLDPDGESSQSFESCEIVDRADISGELEMSQCRVLFVAHLQYLLDLNRRLENTAGQPEVADSRSTTIESLIL